MANRECRGSFFRVGGTAYYQCAWDHAVLISSEGNGPVAFAQGNQCPGCQRQIDGKNYGNVPVQTKTIRQALLPAAGGGAHVVTYQSETRKGP